jgi:hypothetical protein
VSEVSTRPPVDAPHEPIVPAPSSWRLWVVLLGGPAAWFVHFMGVYLTAEAVCTPPLVGSEQPWSDTALDTFVLVATIAFALVCVALGIIATVALRPGWLSDQHEGRERYQRHPSRQSYQEQGGSAHASVQISGASGRIFWR